MICLRIGWIIVFWGRTFVFTSIYVMVSINCLRAPVKQNNKKHVPETVHK